MQFRTVLVLLAAILASANLPDWDVDMIPDPSNPNSLVYVDYPVDTSKVGVSQAVLRVDQGYCAGTCSILAYEPFCLYYGGVPPNQFCNAAYNTLTTDMFPQITASIADTGCLSGINPIASDYIAAGEPISVSFGHYWCEKACLEIHNCIGFSANPGTPPLPDMLPGQCIFYFETVPEECLIGGPNQGSSWTPNDPTNPTPWRTYFFTCPWQTVVGASPSDALNGCNWNSATNTMQCDSTMGGVGPMYPSPSWAPTNAAECETLCTYNYSVGFPNGAQCNTWTWNNGVCTAYTATATSNSVAGAGSYGYNYLGCRGQRGTPSVSVPVATTTTTTTTTTTLPPDTTTTTTTTTLPPTTTTTTTLPPDTTTTTTTLPPTTTTTTTTTLPPDTTTTTTTLPPTTTTTTTLPPTTTTTTTTLPPTTTTTLPPTTTPKPSTAAPTKVLCNPTTGVCDKSNCEDYGFTTVGNVCHQEGSSKGHKFVLQEASKSNGNGKSDDSKSGSKSNGNGKSDDSKSGSKSNGNGKPDDSKSGSKSGSKSHSNGGGEDVGENADCGKAYCQVTNTNCPKSSNAVKWCVGHIVCQEGDCGDFKGGEPCILQDLPSKHDNFRICKA